MSEPSLPMRVWDAPTRLFHWAIVILLVLSWFTQRRGWMELHFLSGYAIIALLLFRIAWGFVGSETARFSRFVKSPLAALRHLLHLHRREPDTEIGHNAAGGWMVLVMLALIAVQVASGFGANDDISEEGPLARHVGKEWSDWLAGIHALNFDLIQIVVLLHILAIIAYAVLKRHNLVGPMITGRKRLPAGMAAPALASPVLALVLFALAVGVVWGLVQVL